MLSYFVLLQVNRTREDQAASLTPPHLAFKQPFGSRRLAFWATTIHAHTLQFLFTLYFHLFPV